MIHLEQQRGRAPLGARLRVEDMGLTERELEGLEPGGVLVQQVAQIRRGDVGRREGQQQRASRSEAVGVLDDPDRPS